MNCLEIPHHHDHQPINVPTAGAQPSLWRTGHNSPRGPNAGRWVITSANAAKNNGLTYLSKHDGARDSKFFVTHLMTDQRCLTSAITRQSALIANHQAPQGLVAYKYYHEQHRNSYNKHLSSIIVKITYKIVISLTKYENPRELKIVK
jgi:hypothetical protein